MKKKKDDQNTHRDERSAVHQKLFLYAGDPVELYALNIWIRWFAFIYNSIFNVFGM